MLPNLGHRRSQTPDTSQFKNRSKGKGFGSGLNFLELARKWPIVVGSYLGEKSIPIKLKNGLLTLVVKHQIYAQEIKFIEKEIISKLHKSFPRLGRNIQKINFVVKDNFSLSDYSFHTDSTLDTAKKESPFQKIHKMSPQFRELTFQANQLFQEIQEVEIKELLTEIFFQSHGQTKG